MLDLVSTPTNPEPKPDVKMSKYVKMIELDARKRRLLFLSLSYMVVVFWLLRLGYNIYCLASMSENDKFVPGWWSVLYITFLETSEILFYEALLIYYATKHPLICTPSAFTMNACLSLLAVSLLKPFYLDPNDEYFGLSTIMDIM